MLRILIAGRHSSAREAMKLHLSRFTGEWQVESEAQDETSLFTATNKNCPDVVILNEDLLQRPLSDLINQLRTICPLIAILVSSGTVEKAETVRAAGADAFMYLGDPPAKLVTKLRIIQSERIQ